MIQFFFQIILDNFHRKQNSQKNIHFLDIHPLVRYYRFRHFFFINDNPNLNHQHWPNGQTDRDGNSIKNPKKSTKKFRRNFKCFKIFK